MLSLLYLRVKAQQYFVSLSYMVVDNKSMLKIWLNLGLNLTIIRGTGPRGKKLKNNWPSTPNTLFIIIHYRVSETDQFRINW